MFLRSSTVYKMPDDDAVHLLGVDLKPLKSAQMIELADAHYEEELFVKLIYSVALSAFQPYLDDKFASIVERKFADNHFDTSDNTSISSNPPVNCLYFDTSHRSPGTCDWSREYKFFTGGSHFLGGIGVYTINLSFDSSLQDKLRSITRIAQYSLQSGNPFKRLLIAVVKPDSWEIAFAHIKIPISPPSSKSMSCRVDISIFREPSAFIQAISSNMKVANVEHKKHTTRFSIS